MLRAMYDVSWRSHPTNKSRYGNLPRISSLIRSRRLGLAGHVTLHKEPAAKLLLWSPDAKRRVGRPNITLNTVLIEDTGMAPNEMITEMRDIDYWRKNFVNASPTPTGVG